MNISLENYEHILMAYLDQELNTQEQKAFLAFAQKHPLVQDELESFQKTILLPEEKIVFKNKEALLKPSTPSFKRKHWAYAASLFLAMATLFFWTTKRKNIDLQEQIVSTPKIVEEQRIVREPAIVPEELVTTSKDINRKHQKTSTPPDATQTEKNSNEIKISPQPKPKEQLAQVDVFTEQKTAEVVPELSIEETKNDLALAAPTQQTKPTVWLEVSQKKTPRLFRKYKSVRQKAKNTIEQLKELKETEVVLAIGDKKLITLNH